MYLSRETFKTDLKKFLDYFNENTILELRLALPIGLIQDKEQDSKVNLITRVAWIGGNEDPDLLRVTSCMQFEISAYAEQGFRMCFSQRLTEFSGRTFIKKTGYNYYLTKGQEAVIEKVVSDFEHFEEQLEDFVQTCNEFYMLYCEPFKKSL